MDFYSTWANTGLFLLTSLLNVFKWFLHSILSLTLGMTLWFILGIRRSEYIFKFPYSVASIFSIIAPLGNIGLYGNQIRNYEKNLGDKL
tara:strand:- start:662 stop:928 length:267 start_codon:yes stop_codon:yes gene_type:complete